MMSFVIKDGVLVKHRRSNNECAVSVPEGVTIIGCEAFKTQWRGDWDDALHTISIPESIEVIERSAFEGACIDMIRLPTGLKTIGASAFRDCKYLKEIVIPEGIAELESHTFTGCISLERVILPKSLKAIGDGCFQGCYFLKSVILPENVTFLGRSVFSDCSRLESVTLPRGLSAFGTNLFYKCSALKSIALPDGLTQIPDYTLYQCESLKNVVLPNHVTRIGTEAFSGCKKLSRTTIPNGVQEIGCRAFFGTSLPKLHLPTSVQQIGAQALQLLTPQPSIEIDSDNVQYAWESGCLIDKKANELVWGNQASVIPPYIISIGARAFAECQELQEIVIPANVRNIGDNAFLGCFNLTSVELLGEDLKIGAGAFEFCRYLKNVTLVHGLAEIGKEAFAYCDRLREISIPKTTTVIGANAFSGCKEMEQVTLNGCTPVIGSRAFSGCEKISAVRYMGDIAGWCTCSFEDARANPLFYAHNLYINDELITQADIPSSVSSVNSFAFCGATCLNAIKLPEATVNLGRGSLYGCSAIKHITLPGSFASRLLDAFVSNDAKADLENAALNAPLAYIPGQKTTGAGPKEKVYLALCYLTAPAQYSEAEQKTYSKYLLRQSSRVLEEIIRRKDLGLFTAALTYGLVTPENYESIFDKACACGTEFAAAIQDYSKEHSVL